MSPSSFASSSTLVIVLALGGHGCGRTPLVLPDPVGDGAGSTGDGGPDADTGPGCTGFVPPSCDGPGDGPAPGQRPSASVDACDWLPESPPGLGGDLPCCELGPVRSLADEADGGGPVSVVSIRGGAVVGWSVEDTRFRRVDDRGAPIDPGPVAYPGRLATFASGACGIASAAQERLVVSSETGIREAAVALGAFPGFTPAAGPRLAYTPFGEGHLVATSGDVGGSDGFLLERIDGDRRVTRQELVGTLPGRVPGVAAVGSLAVVAWVDATAEVAFATLEPGRPLGVLRRVTGLEPIVGFGGVGLGVLRDDVVLASVTGREVRVAMANPFTGEVRVSARAVGTTDVLQRVGVAGADELALIGLCYATGPSPAPPRPRGEDALVFRLLTMDGDPVGPALPVVEGLTAPPRCAIAWAEGRFFVAWWQIDGGTGEGIFVRTVAVTL